LLEVGIAFIEIFFDLNLGLTLSHFRLDFHFHVDLRVDTDLNCSLLLVLNNPGGSQTDFTSNLAMNLFNFRD
jgi:hypothetical protein